LHFTVEDIIAEGDKVVARLTARGTQQGEFMGIPPTGKRATVTAIDINRMVGGKSVEHWLEMDTLGLLQQLGVVPMPGQAR
jgi:predicted ester cyclase